MSCVDLFRRVRSRLSASSSNSALGDNKSYSDSEDGPLSYKKKKSSFKKRAEATATTAATTPSTTSTVSTPVPPALSLNNSTVPMSAPSANSTLLAKFVESHKQLLQHRSSDVVKVDGHTLSTAAIVAAARYAAPVLLDDSPKVKDGVLKSRQVVASKVESGASIYGLSTGFGGSADTRTDQPLKLGHALLQHQHIGVISKTSENAPEVLPLHDPTATTTMPEAWVRAATLVRMNSLIRGHSGVRWELIEKMNEFLSANITPVIPLRGSISASGDLSPLSYIAGALVGNPSIEVYHSPKSKGPRQISPSSDALRLHKIKPTVLASKEHLGLVNGTAVSAAVAALAIDEAVHMAMLAQVLTAMGTEALNGTRGSYHSFIHATARPHPGQVECARNIWNLLEGSKLAHMHEEEVSLQADRYSLRQDRYPLRTAPQFLGPQVEDILSALAAITTECNSTTDNPLIESETGEIHHGGNFQAMAVTNAMEKTRLALHHIGKLLFSQSTEMLNPAMNNGLPPSLAATDPSLNYHGKGIDIATASYVAELGFLATPVSTHIQSAEMHNQAVNSLALISARATVTALDVLSLLISSYLYLLCQAVDLRALRHELLQTMRAVVAEEISSSFKSFLSDVQTTDLNTTIYDSMVHAFDKSTIMDSRDQMTTVAAATSTTIVDYFDKIKSADSPSLATISAFRSRITDKLVARHSELRHEFLGGKRGPAPAAEFLGKTRALYEFVRRDVGVNMHGCENLGGFKNAIGVDEPSIGQKISKIYESLRDGRIQPVIVSLFA